MNGSSGFLRRRILMVLLCLALAGRARAQSFDAIGKEFVAGIVVVSAAVALLTTVLILHYKGKKSAVTGCVIAGTNGLLVTDEADKRAYTLSGHTEDVKPGDHVILEGQRKASTLVFRVRDVKARLGGCAQ